MVQLIASQSYKFQESICKVCCNCCLLECCIYLSGHRSMAASNKWPTTGRLRRAQLLHNLLLPGPVCLSNGPMQMPQPFQALAPTQIPADSIFVLQVSIWSPICMPGERHNQPCYKHLKMLQIGSSVWVAAFLNLHCDNRSRKVCISPGLQFVEVVYRQSFVHPLPTQPLQNTDIQSTKKTRVYTDHVRILRSAAANLQLHSDWNYPL
jgi:hypothetical protein